MSVRMGRKVEEADRQAEERIVKEVEEGRCESREVCKVRGAPRVQCQ